MFASKIPFMCNDPPMIIELNLTGINRDIVLPIRGKVNIFIDYGAPVISGLTQIVESNRTLNSVGTYATGGRKTCKIYGYLQQWGVGSAGAAHVGRDNVIGITSFGTLNIESFSGGFKGYNNLVSVPAEFPTTVTDVSFMFEGSNFNDANINSWNTSFITNMNSMFRNSTFNQNIGNWDTSRVQWMQNTFAFANNFNQPIGNWNTSNVFAMDNMFQWANNFNQPIGNWNTSKVSSMDVMFNSALSFNQNISTWCVTNIPTEPNNFSSGSPLTANNKPIWGTCP